MDNNLFLKYQARLGETNFLFINKSKIIRYKTTYLINRNIPCTSIYHYFIILNNIIISNANIGSLTF